MSGDPFDEEDVWGTLEDDLFLQASQQFESQQAAMIQQAQEQKPDPSVPTHMLRYGLELKANDGTDGDKFMKKGELGGEIKKKGSDEDLVTVNARLKYENFTFRGEIATLRRKLHREFEERQRNVALRQQADKERKKREEETKKQSQNELDTLRAQLRISSNEVKTLTGELRTLHEKSYSSSNVMNSSYQQQSDANNRQQCSPDTTSQFPSTGQSSSTHQSSSRRSVMTRQAFESKEVRSRWTMPEKKEESKLSQLDNRTQYKSSEREIKTTECKSTEVQTDDYIPPETEADKQRRQWRDKEELKKESLTILLDNISVKTNREFNLLLPRLQKLALNAQGDIADSLDIEGFAYDCLFPESLRLAEFKLHQKDLINREGHMKRVRPLMLPVSLTDWEGIHDLDKILGDQLHFHRDVWKALSFVLTELLKRIDSIWTERNSLYRINNLTYFSRLLIWAQNLWEHFIPAVCESWTGQEEPMTFYKNQVTQWTTMMLWMSSRHLDVKAAQVEIRKLILKILDKMLSLKYFIYNETNYTRLHSVVWDTLTVERHLNYDNLYLCLQLVKSVDRRNFYLHFMCSQSNNGKCLLEQIGRNTLDLFKKKKRDSVKRFRIYEAYISFLHVLRGCCMVHKRGQCSTYPIPPEDPDEPDDLTTMPFLRHSNPVWARTIPSEDPESPRLNITEGDYKCPYYLNLATPSTLEDGSKPSNPIIEFVTRNCVMDDSQFVTSLPTNAWSSSQVPVIEENISSLKGLTLEDQYMVEIENQPEPGSSRTRDYVNDVVMMQKQSSEEQMECEQEDGGEAGGSHSDPLLECLNFLDCTYWEEDKKKLKNLCQCRYFLMQSFMIMTEEMVYFWRHVKSSSEFENSKVNASEKLEAEKRAEEFEQVVKKLKLEEKKKETEAGISQTEQDFELEQVISEDVEYLQHIKRDNENYFQNSLKPEHVQEALDTAVLLLYDAYTSANNTTYAFGQEGSSAFTSALALLYYHMEDLKFTDSIQEMIKQMAEELFTRQLTEDSDSENLDIDMHRENAVAEEPQFDVSFDTADVQVQDAVPNFLIEAIKKFQCWKQDSKRLSSTAVEAGRKEKSIFPTTSKEDIQKIEKFEKTITAMRTGDKDVEIIEMDVDKEPTEEEVIVPLDCTSDDDDELDDNVLDCADLLLLPHPGRDSDESDEENVEWKNVEDYENFCRSGKLLTDDEDDDEPPRVTTQNLRVLFKQKQNIRGEEGGRSREMMPKIKTVRQVCEEMRLNNSRTDPSVVVQQGPNEEANEFVNRSMRSLKYKDYYKMDNFSVLWNDLKDDAYPVTI